MTLERNEKNSFTTIQTHENHLSELPSSCGKSIHWKVKIIIISVNISYIYDTHIYKFILSLFSHFAIFFTFIIVPLLLCSLYSVRVCVCRNFFFSFNSLRSRCVQYDDAHVVFFLPVYYNQILNLIFFDYFFLYFILNVACNFAINGIK